MNIKNYVGSPGYKLLVGNLYTLDVNKCEYINPDFTINIKKLVSIKDKTKCPYCGGANDVSCIHCNNGRKRADVLINVSFTIKPEYYMMNSGNTWMFNSVNHNVCENSHPKLIDIKSVYKGQEIIIELINKTSSCEVYFTQEDIDNGSITIINHDSNNVIKYKSINKMFYLKSKEDVVQTRCDCSGKYKSIEGVTCKKCNNTSVFNKNIYVPDFTVHECNDSIDFVIDDKGIKYSKDVVDITDVNKINLTTWSAIRYYTSEKLANKMSKKYKEYYDNSYYYKIICNKCVVKWDCDGYEYIGRGQTSYTNIENKMNYTDTVDSMNFTMQVDLSEAYVFYLSNEIDPTEKIILEQHLYQGDLEVESYNYTFTYGELYNSNDSDAISILKDECESEINAIINNRVTELIKTKGILNETNN